MYLFYFVDCYQSEGCSLIYAFVQIRPSLEPELAFILLFVVCLKSSNEEVFILVLQTFFTGI